MWHGRGYALYLVYLVQPTLQSKNYSLATAAICNCGLLCFGQLYLSTNKIGYKLELKMFYQTYTARKAIKINPRQRRNGAVCSCVTSLATSTFHSVVAGGDGSGQRVFCHGWPCPLTLTFKLVRARDQTHLPREFGANPFQPFRRYLRHKWKKNLSQTQR